MAYTQPNSPFKQVAAKAATRKKGGSSYDNFIDSTASYLKGEQGLVPDSLTGGKPTKQAIGDGIRKVANSIDPSKKLKKSTKKALSVSKGPKPKGPKPSKPTPPSKPSKPSPKPDPSKYNLQYPKPANLAEMEAREEYGRNKREIKQTWIPSKVIRKASPAKR